MFEFVLGPVVQRTHKCLATPASRKVGVRKETTCEAMDFKQVLPAYRPASWCCRMLSAVAECVCRWAVSGEMVVLQSSRNDSFRLFEGSLEKSDVL